LSRRIRLQNVVSLRKQNFRRSAVLQTANLLPVQGDDRRHKTPATLLSRTMVNRAGTDNGELDSGTVGSGALGLMYFGRTKYAAM
jgi:hypothetical protein